MFGDNQVSFMDGAATMNMKDDSIKKLDLGNSMNTNFNNTKVYGDITTPDIRQSIKTRILPGNIKSDIKISGSISLSATKTVFTSVAVITAACLY